MAINLASKASPKVVERFTRKSCTEGLFTQDYDWTGVATVRVYSVDTLTLNTYDKSVNAGTASVTVAGTGMASRRTIVRLYEQVKAVRI